MDAGKCSHPPANMATAAQLTLCEDFNKWINHFRKKKFFKSEGRISEEKNKCFHPIFQDILIGVKIN